MTGIWLQQLQSDSLPRITAPGLAQGWFGPWQEDEEDNTTPEHDGRAGASEALWLLCPQTAKFVMHREGYQRRFWSVLAHLQAGLRHCAVTWKCC